MLGLAIMDGAREPPMELRSGLPKPEERALSMARTLVVLMAITVPTLPMAAQLQGQLYVYGGRNNDTFLGCLTCGSYDPDSVYNEYGLYGSRYGVASIFNDFGQFGSRHSPYSPCNRFGSQPPVVVDNEGRFYGYLTVKSYHPDRIDHPALNALLAAACRE